jgi:enterochelin esterase family protein
LPPTVEAAWSSRPGTQVLEAGLLENQRDAPHITILRANRHLRTVLQAKGYSVQYMEYSGGLQPLCWQGTLSTGLVALLGTKGTPLAIA